MATNNYLAFDDNQKITTSHNAGSESLFPVGRRSFVLSIFAALTLPKLSPSALAEEEVIREIPLKNPVQLAVVAAKSTVCLVMNQERAASCGSATLIRTPPILKPLLHEDEVLAVSVAHNFSDWNPSNILIAGRFRTISPNGEGTDEQRYHARLVNRFTHLVGDPNALVDTSTSYKSVDVSLVAIRIPQSERREIEDLLLTFPPTGAKIQQGQRMIAIGFGPHSSQEHKISPLVAIPPISWRQGACIGSTEEKVATQFGIQSVQNIHTTISNVQGDSGGGLFIWDKSGTRPILVGICTAGGEVEKGTADFDGFLPAMPPIYTLPPGQSTEGIPKDGRIARSEAEANSIMNTIRRERMGWVLDSQYRGLFCHTDAVSALIDQTATMYTGLVKKRESIVEAQKKLASHIETRTLLPGKENSLTRELDTLYREAFRSIDDQISAFKPKR